MQGDSFHFAFPFARVRSGGAVRCSARLPEHEWEIPADPRPDRACIPASRQADGLYAGVDVHRAARVMSAGTAARSSSPPDRGTRPRGDWTGITLLDLGEHRLKDLDGAAAALPGAAAGCRTFPPLQIAPPERTCRCGLAAIWARAELAEVSALIARRRRGSLTITGTGGSGKTRLALQAASESPSGSRTVSSGCRSPAADPGLVLSTIAQALGVKDDLPVHRLGSACCSCSTTSSIPDRAAAVLSGSWVRVPERHRLS